MQCVNDITLSIIQGDDYASQDLDVLDAAGDPIDISTGYTAQMMARSTVDSDTAVISLSESAGLTLGNGTISITRTAAQTALYDFTGKLVFDIKVTKTADSTVHTVARGIVQLTKAVTHA